MRNRIILAIFLYVVTFSMNAWSQGSGAGMTDIDGNYYPSVIIGNQEWTQTNLKTTRYDNGDTIPNNLTDVDWFLANYGATAVVANYANYDSIHGRLYNWYAVSDNRNLCPAGWHVPSSSEWFDLANYLGGLPIAGGKMKDIDTTYWTPPNIGATNSSNFTGLPSGFRNGTNGVSSNTVGKSGNFWASDSSTNFSTTAWYAYLYYVYEDLYVLENQAKEFGFSVRCVKDSINCTGLNSNDTVFQTSCDSVLFNNIWHTSSGDYTYSFFNISGCDSIVTLTLNLVNNLDFVSLGTERTTTLCPNDSVKIFVVNPQGPGLSYQWYKADAIIPGAVDSFFYADEVRKYKVRVSNGSGCTRMSGRIQPTVAIPPSVTITPQGSTDICAGDSVLLVANYVPGYSYQWRRYGVDIPGANNTMYYASQPGNYKIFITNDGGCISKSSNVSVNIVCRVAGSSVTNDVEVMPNPTTDNFSVRLNDLGEEVPVSVEFIDQQGRLIESRRVNGQTLLDFTAIGLSNGNYTVIVRFESGETVEKVVSVVR